MVRIRLRYKFDDGVRRQVISKPIKYSNPALRYVATTMVDSVKRKVMVLRVERKLLGHAAPERRKDVRW